MTAATIVDKSFVFFTLNQSTSLCSNGFYGQMSTMQDQSHCGLGQPLGLVM